MRRWWLVLASAASCFQQPARRRSGTRRYAREDEELTLVYDSQCWACQWEVDHLSAKGAAGRIKFADVESDDYDASATGVSYADGMRSIRAVRRDGSVLEGPDAFRGAYDLVEPTALGAFWALAAAPVLKPIVDAGYAAFAAARPYLTRGASVEALALARARKVVASCARDRGQTAAAVLEALDALRSARPCPPTAASFRGTWELVFTSSIAAVPFLGGYMPNREILVWDLDRGVLDLEIETLPPLPKIAITGERLSFSDSQLIYTVGDKPPSTWDVFHADGDVICADSSVTGANVIRRISGAD